MTADAAQRLPTGRLAVLGLITIAVYGSWYYSFGVLLDPILDDTGWAEPALTSAFGISSFAGGIAGLAGGWLLDRAGSRVVFTLGAAGGLAAFQLAAGARSVSVFAVTAAIGGATLGALGMYHITQTLAVRIGADSSTKAIAVLTIWGAFASAIYVPMAGWLVEPLGWRLSLRLLTGSAVAALSVGAIMINVRLDHRVAHRALAELRSSLRSPAVRRYVIAVGLVGMGTATLLVYQVPAMTAAGMPLTAASFWAGFRGFSQLTGRLPLMLLADRIGVIRSLRLAIAAIATGMVVLAFAGGPVLGLAYALIAGFGVGALSPLQGMTTRDLFDEDALGTAMGFLGGMFLTVGAVGPVIAGFVADATGSRAIPVIGAAVVTALAAVVIPGD